MADLYRLLCAALVLAAAWACTTQAPAVRRARHAASRHASRIARATAADALHLAL